MDNIKRIYKRNTSTFFSYAIAIFMFIVVSIFRPEFASIGHIKIMTIDAAILGILALGQTFTILVGGIDLSIEWNMCAAGIMMTMLQKPLGLGESQTWILMLITLAVTTSVGFINGFGVAYLGINPMIMTFGMNTIIQGVVIGLTSGTLPGGYSPENLENFSLGTFLGLPNMLWVWILIIVVFSLLLACTPYGRKLYAVGNSETVAYYSGVKVKFVKMCAYAISGFAAGLGGILFTGRIGQSYLGMGSFVMFQTIAVVAVGGTSMIGGSGNYIGTVAGAFILTITNGLLSAFLIPAAVQQIIYGIILLIAVFISISRKKKSNVI